MRNLLIRSNAYLFSNADSFPRFEILAYNGGMLDLGFEYPVVINLSSTVVAGAGVPLLYQHQAERIVGQAEKVELTPTNIHATGVINGSGDDAREVKANAANGYKWQVSVGVETKNLHLIESNKTVVLNGQTFVGPVYVADDNTLREISFLSLGADSSTYAKLLVASLKGSTMLTFEEWLASLSIDPTTLADAEKTIAQRIYDAWKSQMDAAKDDKTKVEAASKIAAGAMGQLISLKANRVPPVLPPLVPPIITPTATDPVADLRAKYTAETDRLTSIQVLSAEFHNPMVNGVSLASTAIKDGWDAQRTRNEMELHKLRNARPTTIHAGARNGGSTGNFTRAQVLECAIAQSGKHKSLEKSFNEQLLEVAHKQYKSRIGLKEFLCEAAYANGYDGSTNVKANLRAMLQAAFSTIEIPTVVSNTANKFMVEGFESVDDSWRLFTKIGSVVDFKEVAGYRGVGAFRFDQIGPTGEIHHATLTEATYGNKADTYAKMISIPRQVWINDDLGYLTSIPRQIGRGGALALVHVVYTEFMDNSSFFASGNVNVSTGALSIAGLNAALAVFRKQVDENGDYVMAKPTTLLVPVELEEVADQLYTSGFRGGSATGDSDENPHRGKYKPVVSPYLSDTRFTGNSTTAYYLLADPNDVPVIEVVFLDGVETPTVETAEVDFNQLGVQMRGYFDFGARLQEYRSGVRSTGA